MITAAQWVPRGFAAPFPKKYTLDESEFERIAELAKLQLDDAEEDLKEAQEEEEAGSDGEKGTAADDEGMEVEGEKPTSEAKFVVPF
jgi:periodic tryptophan protein 1